MSANEWADAIVQSLSKNVEKVPDGFYTARQISKMLNKSMTYTKSMIRNLLDNDLAEMKIFKIQAANKQAPTPHYKIIK